MDPALQSLLTRLDHLSDQFRELKEGIHKAVRIADDDPEMALTRARKVLEYVIREVYQRRIQEPPGTRPLENLLQRLVKDGWLPDRLDAYANTIRKLGNVGTHTFGERVTVADVYQSLTQLMPILEWYFEVEHPDAAGHKAPPAAPAVVPRTPASASGPRLAVVPKGLRSFDAKDADFFLELLPGPRDKDGLPESIRFWKHRIEAGDEPTFAVGVIYGPSGCGKSSLVKAGLLPRLSERVLAVYVEATAQDTEARLLGGLRKRCPDLAGDLDLPGSVAASRNGKDGKVLLVIDQFEQWLHGRRGDSPTDLVQALRQCDGEHVQCLVLVRDDFWVALSRFMGDLHIELLQGQNLALVDLFDLIHARQVLLAFGRAFGRLEEDPTKDQETFLDQAVAGLAQDGRVISVRLALFAEMVKARPWTPATLKAVGGTEGVGVTFLEETFGIGANARHRPHLPAAQAILKALLPEQGSDIKGNMRSHLELLQASGYAGRTSDFASLMRILDSELRLITPTEAAAADGGQYYQLTHDYLVPSLRAWLRRKQQESRRGRAEMLLADRAAIWNARRENRQLPSLWQWLQIRLLVAKRDWTGPQWKMMARAGRHHALRTAAGAVLLALAAFVGLTIRERVVEAHNETYAAGLVQSLLNADTAQVPDLIKAMADYRQWTDPLLREEKSKAAAKSPQELKASLALLPDPAQVDYLYNRLLAAKPADLPVIRDALAPHKDALLGKLWVVAEDPAKAQQRLRAAAALAKYDPQSGRWAKAGTLVASDLAAENSVYLGQWSEAFQPVKQALLAPLADIFHDPAPEHAAQRALATNLLADYAAGNSKLLADLIMDADPQQFRVVFDKLKVDSQAATPLLAGELAKLESTQSRVILQEQGTINADSERVKIEGLKNVNSLAAKQYAVPTTAGRAYTIKMASTRVEAFLVLQDKTGKQLAYFDSLGGGKDAVLDYSCEEGGDYQVFAASNKGTGAFSLSVIEIDGREDAKEKLAKRQANAAVALLRLGQGTKVWPLFKRDPEGFDDPRLRSYLIHRLSPLGADPGLISQRLEDEPDITIRRALILSLGSFGDKEPTPAARAALIPKLQELYSKDPDAGLHAAAEWLLRQWQQNAWLEQMNEQWAKKDQRDQRLDEIRAQLQKADRPASAPAGPCPWYVNSQGQAMVVIPGPVEFVMGSPLTEVGRYSYENQHSVRIGRTFAIAAKAVTVEQFAKFEEGYRQRLLPVYTRTKDLPAVTINWYDAAHYCNWLSKEEGIDAEQWCFEIKGPQDVELKANYLSLEGYRLPTEAEMEYATRAGVKTARYYGETEELLPKYAWYLENSLEKTWPVGRLKPNDYGLFDVHGNAFTWCQERYKSYPQSDKIMEDKEGDLIVGTGSRVLRGGSFFSQASFLRSALRGTYAPSNRNVGNGFRPARTLPLVPFTALPPGAEGAGK